MVNPVDLLEHGRFSKNHDKFRNGYLGRQDEDGIRSAEISIDTTSPMHELGSEDVCENGTLNATDIGSDLKNQSFPKTYTSSCRT